LSEYAPIHNAKWWPKADEADKARVIQLKQELDDFMLNHDKIKYLFIFFIYTFLIIYCFLEFVLTTIKNQDFRQKGQSFIHT